MSHWTAPPLLPWLLLRSLCTDLRMNESIPHAIHHRLQGYYKKDLEQSSITLAEATAPYNVALKTAAVKQVIRKEHLPTATGQKITGTQHGFKTELQAVKIFLFSSKLICWEWWYRGNSHSGTINIEPIYTRNMPLCKLYRQKTEDGNQSK